jgi:hypothetical protein
LARRRNRTRPRIVFVRLYLWPGSDDDLIELFDNAPKRGRAAIVRERLRGRNCADAPVDGPDSQPAGEVDLTGLLFG